MVEVSHSQNHLTIGEVTVSLRHAIKEVVEQDERIVVLLDVPSGETDNRNVLAFDWTGSQVWTIEASDDEGRDNPYMSLKDVDDDLIVEAWNGMRYVIDKDTGKIQDGEIRRF